jgi:hypothetical protein
LEYSGPVLVIDTTTGEVVDEFEEWRTEDGWKKFFFRKTDERLFVGVCDEGLLELLTNSDLLTPGLIV